MAPARGAGTLTADRALRIGLTGPIGCGKSTVAGWLAGRGAAVVDADVIARDVTPPGSAALAAVVARFGAEVLDGQGALDRARLGRRVFGDPEALAALERIVHPLVRPRIEAAIRDADRDGRAVVVVEAIKLVEGGLAPLCDEVWLVVCDPSEQRDRLAARGVAPADAAARIASQGDISGRLTPVATRRIDTSGEPAAAEARVVDALAAARSALAGR